MINVVLWIGQVVLALVFAQVGYGHSLAFPQWSERAGMGWMAVVGRDRMAIIGTLEVLGASGSSCPRPCA